MAASARVVNNRSDRTLAEDPYFMIPADVDSLRILERGIHGNSDQRSIVDLLLKSSEEWIASSVMGIQRPGLRLELGFKPGVALISGHSLLLYAVALADQAKELAGVQFSSIRMMKRHGDSTTLSIGEVVEAKRPAGAAIAAITTRRSYATPAFASEIQDGTQEVRKVAVTNGPLWFHVSFETGLPRTWSRLWEPTVRGALALQSDDALAGTMRITELGFDHQSVGEQLGHRVQLTLSASRMPARR